MRFGRGLAARAGHQPSNLVIKLPVAGPRITHQAVQRGRRKSCAFDVHGLAVFVQKLNRQQRNILDDFQQRRFSDRFHLTEPPNFKGGSQHNTESAVNEVVRANTEFAVNAIPNCTFTNH